MQEPPCAETVDSTTNHVRGHHHRALSFVLNAGGEGPLNGSLSVQPPAATSLSSSAVVVDEGRGSLLASSASTGSLVGGFLNSPMDNSANLSGGSSSSILFSSLLTPRRKLSMDLDESTQDASDSGYSRGDSVSVSSVESCLNFTSALEGVFSSKPQTSTITTRTPLGDLTNAAGSKRGRQRLSQKAKRSISFPNEEKSKRVLPLRLERQSPTCSPISSLPPLPYSPLSHDSTASSSRKNSLQLINSPLERMSLMSPGVSSASSSADQPLSASRAPPFIFPPRPARESSIESDGYSEEVFDREDSSSSSSSAEISSLPSRLTALMNAPFTSDASNLKKDAKFCLHKPPVHSTPTVLPARSSTVPVAGRPSLIRADSCSLPRRIGSLKRASPCPEASDQPRKKKPPLPVLDSKSQDGLPTETSPLKGVQLLRSQSCSLGGATDHHVGLYPLSPGSDNGEIIGDHSKTYALPLCKNPSVPDLKCISPKTLSELLRGDKESGSLVDEYLVLDCRYPYEYEGGHIPGAQNIWDKDTLQDKFFTGPEYTPSSRRRVIIFHCEFSTKRGPDMSRFMRSIDRKKNDMAFPKLYYPELYLLEGGYKAFYEQFPDLCQPNCYVKMVDENHKDELRHFKQRSKSWTGGEAATCKRRGSKLRPRRSTIDNGHAPSGALAPPPSIKS